jgi:hypothetical protein
MGRRCGLAVLSRKRDGGHHIINRKCLGKKRQGGYDNPSMQSFHDPFYSLLVPRHEILHGFTQLYDAISQI